MKPSKRLDALISQVQGHCLADIGCDHGYVVIRSLLEDRVEKAYACDIAEKPLEKARENIQEAHLEKRASCLLMNGIEHLPEGVDILVIAGMGGKMMIDILHDGRAHLVKGMKLILSPHKDAPSLRSYLNENGFDIQKETIVEEGHFYPIFSVIYDQCLHAPLQDKEHLYGLHVQRDRSYQRFLEHEYKKWKEILSHRPLEKKPEALVHLQLIMDLIKECE